jgi:site-specific DNA recombinase
LVQPLRVVPAQAERAILYLRQSVKKDDSVSLELQETSGRDHAARSGYEVVDVVPDPNRTGTTLKRRQVLDVIERVRRGEVKVIVVWRWSRLARSRRDFAVVCDVVESLGGRVESAAEPIDVRTASGRLARGMMAEVAAWESEQRGEVWREVHERRRRLGVPAQGGRRFGYIQTGKDTYAIDPVTGPILASMYRDYLAGVGFMLIAHRLNNDGITTLPGSRWDRTRVTKVLDSGFGAGQIVAGAAKRRPVYTPGAHDAVITDEEWRNYRELREALIRQPISREPVYLLSGLIRCGDCKRPMHAQHCGVRPGYGYVCSGWSQGRNCRCITITRAKAERAVAAWLDLQTAEVDMAAKRQAKAAAARVATAADTADLARRITQLDARLDKLTAGWAEDLVPDGTYQRTRDEIKESRRSLVDQLVVAERRLQVGVASTIPAGLVDAWPDMTVPEQRSVLAPLIADVVVMRPKGSRRGGGSGVWVAVHSTWGEEFIYRE